jgi:hypothetical protein
MGEHLHPLTTDKGTQPISHRDILIVMGVVVVVSTIAGFIFGGKAFGFGVIFGGILSYVNYFWLERSTRAMFVNAEMASTGLLAAKYILRYVALGAVLFLIYMVDVIPVAAVILGLSAFALAVVLQGLKNIISSSF